MLMNVNHDKAYPHHALLKVLRKRTFGHGQMTAFATQAGVSVAYVSEILKGKRKISQKIALALGYEKRDGYRKVTEVSQ